MSNAPTNRKRPRNRVGSRELVRCLWALGPVLGYRYWKIQRLCAARPDFVSVWAFRCRVEATECEWREEYKMAALLRKWSDDLEAHFAANTKFRDARAENPAAPSGE